jgi:hypothetical protein
MSIVVGVIISVVIFLLWASTKIEYIGKGCTCVCDCGGCTCSDGCNDCTCSGDGGSKDFYTYDEMSENFDAFWDAVDTKGVVMLGEEPGEPKLVAVTMDYFNSRFNPRN